MPLVINALRDRHTNGHTDRDTQTNTDKHTHTDMLTKTISRNQRHAAEGLKMLYVAIGNPWLIAKACLKALVTF